jgi:hypothetical protein
LSFINYIMILFFNKFKLVLIESPAFVHNGGLEQLPQNLFYLNLTAE